MNRNNTGILDAENEGINETKTVLKLKREPKSHVLVSIVAGFSSGATKLLVGHPFDVIKVRMQASSRFEGPWQCLKSTVAKEGLLALYKGATPPLLGWALMDATQMTSLTYFRHLITSRYGEELGSFKHAIAGTGAGIVVSFVASPIELIKVKLQLQYQGEKRYTSAFDCVKKLIRANGITGMYQGLSACLLFRSFFCVLWGSYDIYTKALTNHLPASSLPFICGGLAANTFWMVCFPFDVIKNRAMADQNRWTSIRTIFHDVLRTQGPKGFYRGFVPCMLRSFPTNGAAIFVFETFRDKGNALFE